MELNVTIDKKLNKILDDLVDRGIFLSKAELMRSATIFFLAQSGLLKEILKEPDHSGD